MEGSWFGFRAVLNCTTRALCNLGFDGPKVGTGKKCVVYGRNPVFLNESELTGLIAMRINEIVDLESGRGSTINSTAYLGSYLDLAAL